MSDSASAGRGEARADGEGRRRHRAAVRAHGELGDFLPAGRRGRWFVHEFDVEPAVKDVVEAVGVPHPEVGALLVDGCPAGFEHRVGDGASIEVFPRGAVPRTARPAGPPPPSELRFVLDVHLGRLARWLRLVGFDAWYRPDADDRELAARSASEGRILLTRDRELLKRSEVAHGSWVRHTDPDEQVVEVLGRFGGGTAARPLAPFTRCMACSGRLEAVEKREVEGELEPGTRAAHEEFRRCRGCGRIYWPGAHHRRLAALVDEVQRRLRVG